MGGRMNGSGGRGDGGRGRFQGTPADRLVRLWRSDDPQFEALLDDILDSGRQAIIEAALDKLREGEHDSFLEDVETLAEMSTRIDSDGERLATALYFFIVEAADVAAPPHAASFEESLDSCELFPGNERLTILPAWLEPEALSYLEACDRRALLRHMMVSTDGALRFVAAEELVAVPGPGPEEGRLVAVLGLLDEPMEDVERAAGEEMPDDEPDEAEIARVDAAITTLNEELARADRRILRCMPVGGLDEMLAFFSEPSWQEDDQTLQEIVDFIGTARDETADGIVDVELSVTDEVLRIAVLASDGGTLDINTFAVPAGGLSPALARLAPLCRTVRSAG